MKLICATNFSMNADTTAMGAACLAARMNIPLLLTHVVDPSLYDDATEDFLAKVKSDREEKLQRVADWLRPCGASVETLVL